MTGQRGLSLGDSFPGGSGSEGQRVQPPLTQKCKKAKFKQNKNFPLFCGQRSKNEVGIKTYFGDFQCLLWNPHHCPKDRIRASTKVHSFDAGSAGEPGMCMILIFSSDGYGSKLRGFSIIIIQWTQRWAEDTPVRWKNGDTPNKHLAFFLADSNPRGLALETKPVSHSRKKISRLSTPRRGGGGMRYTLSKWCAPPSAIGPGQASVVISSPRTSHDPSRPVRGEIPVIPISSWDHVDTITKQEQREQEEGDLFLAWQPNFQIPFQTHVRFQMERRPVTPTNGI